MKLFQIIFIVGCIIVGVLGAPGHVSCSIKFISFEIFALNFYNKKKICNYGKKNLLSILLNKIFYEDLFCKPY